MALHLTPLILEGAYNYLRVTPPFARWRMLDPDEIEFAVVNDERVHGWYWQARPGVHRIAASIAGIGHTTTLMQTMAHEMVHLYQACAGLETRAPHNADFKKRMALVAKYHGFDARLI